MAHSLKGSSPLWWGRCGGRSGYSCGRSLKKSTSHQPSRSREFHVELELGSKAQSSAFSGLPSLGSPTSHKSHRLLKTVLSYRIKDPNTWAVCGKGFHTRAMASGSRPAMPTCLLSGLLFTCAGESPQSHPSFRHSF